VSVGHCFGRLDNDNPNPGPLGCYNGDGSAAEEEELSSKSSTPVGYHWHDTIALGSYGFDQHRLENSTCVLPQYLQYGGLPKKTKLVYKSLCNLYNLHS
jgi:hypothetical protein